ncbi:ATP-binding protein [Pseudopedobacter beijingensis]|uniref:ATP-binding protein n=1 Tax=Pseudopedobacter beijingensis TaxID=1207056 RepID=A0ABW4IBB6_9SPHI
MEFKKTLLSTAFGLITVFSANAQHSLEKVWETKETIPVPESVLIHEKTKTLYVSLIDGEGNVKDGIGGVGQLNMDGSVKNLNWITGLNAPKGLGMYKDKMYVADLDVVVVIDINKGKVLEKLEVPDAIFLNDITVDSKGTVYVSDTRKGFIYKIIGNKVELYMEKVKSANGLKAIGTDLYVLAGPELWKINANKEITVIAKGFEKGGDGIEPVGNGDFLVTCWPGIIYYVKADGTFEKMLDVQGKMNTADLAYDAKSKMLYVPTFNAKSVVAYKLK